ncbi:delta1-piperideine-2-carboxylate reductase [Rhodoligotrophos appendicifer]
MKLSAEDLRQLVMRIFLENGCSETTARALTHTVMTAEVAGTLSHGVFRMPGYVSSLRAGWVDGKAEPIVEDRAPGVVTVDGANGFSQVAQEAGRDLVMDKARHCGIAALSIRNAHHYAALWPDLEPFGEAGLAGLAFVNSLSLMAPWGGTRALLGTNPMGFVWPRAGKPPLLWDQASSVMAHGEVLMHARDGKSLPPGVGYDAEGRETTDPAGIRDGGALASFGKHKGTSIALMVELLAAGLGGGLFGFEDQSRKLPPPKTCSAGMTIIVIDPARFGDGVIERAEDMFAEYATNEGARLPGERRHGNRDRSAAQGLEVADAQYEKLMELLPAG